MMALLDSLSDHVNAGLEQARYPRLTPLLTGDPGRIVVGDRHEYDQLVPPRILFRPVSSTFDSRSSGRGPVPLATNATRPDAESRAAMAMRAIAAEECVFEASVWSVAPDGFRNPTVADYEFTRALYLQLIASLGATMPGCYKVGNGTWRPVPHVSRVGREFVFNVSFLVPVLAEIEPLNMPGLPELAGGLPFAPADVAPDIHDSLVLSTGESGPGCEPDDT